MRISEAIRIGSAMKPQAFGHFFSNGGSCALGAGIDACSLYGANHGFAYREQPWERELCPVCKLDWSQREALDNHPALVPHMNDVHRMSREEIADYIEIWEAKYSIPEIEVPVKPQESASKVTVDPLADLFPATEQEHEEHMNKVYQEELEAASEV